MLCFMRFCLLQEVKLYVVVPYYPCCNLVFSLFHYILSYITIHQNPGKYKIVPRVKLSLNI